MSDENKNPHGESLTELKTERQYVLRLATLKERFAAFLADGIFCLYGVLALDFLLQHFLQGRITTQLYFEGMNQILYASTSLAFIFLYFFLFEAIFTATPGKMLARLTIHKKKGGSPSLIAILTRNVFRFIDLPLFFITGIGLMEATRRRQRLGDVLASTIVLRKISFEGRRVNPDEAICSGATRRTFAWSIDLFLTATFGYGLLSLLPSHRPLWSMAGLHLLPLMIILTLTLCEFLFQATVGKTLFGMKVVEEDGRPASLAALLVRNLFRIMDMNPLGYLFTALSSYRQRPGDIAAGTLVVNDRRGWRSWFSIPFMFILTASVFYGGWTNPHNFFKEGRIVRIATFQWDPIPIMLRRLTVRGLQIESLKVGFNEEEPNDKSIFDAGDTVYLLLAVSGYEIRNEKAWLQTDVQVLDPQGQPVLNREKMIHEVISVGHQKVVHLATRFALNPQAIEGSYQVTVTLTDLFGNTNKVERTRFLVKR